MIEKQILSWEEFKTWSERCKGWLLYHVINNKVVAMGTIVKVEWLLIGVPGYVFCIQGEKGPFTVVLSTLFTDSQPVATDEDHLVFEHELAGEMFLFARQEVASEGREGEVSWFAASILPFILSIIKTSQRLLLKAP